MANEHAKNENGLSHRELKDLLADKVAFNEVVKNAGLSDIHLRKPLLDGNSICKMFEVKPGKIMKPLTVEVSNFMILNPLAKESDVRSYMVSNKELFLMKFS